LQVRFYDVFQAHGQLVPRLPETKEPSEPSSINCLAFSATGLYFCIGCIDGNVYIMDTSSVNDGISVEGGAIHECVLITPREKSLSSITAVAFGGQERSERVIVGDRLGNVRENAFPILVPPSL
jgi:hypothetical protein